MQRVIASLLIFGLLMLVACDSNTSLQSPVSGGASSQGRIGNNSTLDNLIACPPRSNTVAKAAESGIITLTVSGWASSPAEDALVLASIKKFHEAHPSIFVKWTPISGDYPTNMRSAFTYNHAPDVFYMQPGSMAPDYITNGRLLDLSPYMARDDVQASSYYSSLINLFSCKTGQVYGIPKDWNSLGVFYNKQMFQAAGIPFPTANWTWDDMRTDASKLTKLNSVPSVYGMTLPDNASRWLAFFFASGGTILNHDGTQANFNQQAGVDALKFYASFQLDDRSSVLPSDVVSQPWPGDVLEAFAKQRAAMALEGGWLIPYMAGFRDVQYGIAPLPVAPNGKRGNLIFTNAWSAASTTKHPEAAWEFIKYMTGQAVQSRVLSDGFALPSLKSLATKSYFTQHPEVKVLFDAASYGTPDYYGPSDALIHDALHRAIGSVLSGDTDAQTALDDAVKQVDKSLQ